MSVDNIIGIPSKGRLRDEVIGLLGDAGYRMGDLRGRSAIARLSDGLSLIEMRPRDAAVALAARRIDAAFIATDLVMENNLDRCPSHPLGFSKSDLVVACRNDGVHTALEDLAGCVVATHLPQATKRLFEAREIAVTIMEMAGSLEGVCAAGLADAIVDLRETGVSLAQNGLRVLQEMRECQAELVFQLSDVPEALRTLASRIQSVLQARRSRYVLLHLPKARLPELQKICPGLETPTVLPLLGAENDVAVHLVMESAGLWSKLDEFKALGATSIVSITPDAIA